MGVPDRPQIKKRETTYTTFRISSTAVTIVVSANRSSTCLMVSPSRWRCAPVAATDGARFPRLGEAWLAKR